MAIYLDKTIQPVYPLMNRDHLYPNSIRGRGQVEPYDTKFSEKCPCSHNDNTAVIKQISLFDTAIVMANTQETYLN